MWSLRVILASLYFVLSSCRLCEENELIKPSKFQFLVSCAQKLQVDSFNDENQDFCMDKACKSILESSDEFYDCEFHEINGYVLRKQLETMCNSQPSRESEEMKSCVKSTTTKEEQKLVSNILSCFLDNRLNYDINDKGLTFPDQEVCEIPSCQVLLKIKIAPPRCIFQGIKVQNFIQELQFKCLGSDEDDASENGEIREASNIQTTEIADEIKSSVSGLLLSSVQEKVVPVEAQETGESVLLSIQSELEIPEIVAEEKKTSQKNPTKLEDDPLNLLLEELNQEMKLSALKQGESDALLEVSKEKRCDNMLPNIRVALSNIISCSSRIGSLYLNEKKNVVSLAQNICSLQSCQNVVTSSIQLPACDVYGIPLSRAQAGLQEICRSFSRDDFVMEENPSVSESSQYLPSCFDSKIQMSFQPFFTKFYRCNIRTGLLVLTEGEKDLKNQICGFEACSTLTNEEKCPNCLLGTTNMMNIYAHLREICKKETYSIDMNTHKAEMKHRRAHKKMSRGKKKEFDQTVRQGVVKRKSRFLNKLGKVVPVKSRTDASPKGIIDTETIKTEKLDQLYLQGTPVNYHNRFLTEKDDIETTNETGEKSSTGVFKYIANKIKVGRSSDKANTEDGNANGLDSNTHKESKGGLKSLINKFRKNPKIPNDQPNQEKDAVEATKNVREEEKTKIHVPKEEKISVTQEQDTAANKSPAEPKIDETQVIEKSIGEFTSKEAKTEDKSAMEQGDGKIVEDKSPLTLEDMLKLDPSNRPPQPDTHPIGTPKPDPSRGKDKPIPGDVTNQRPLSLEDLLKETPKKEKPIKPDAPLHLEDLMQQTTPIKVKPVIKPTTLEDLVGMQAKPVSVPKEPPTLLKDIIQNESKPKPVVVQEIESVQEKLKADHPLANQAASVILSSIKSSALDIDTKELSVSLSKEVIHESNNRIDSALMERKIRRKQENEQTRENNDEEILTGAEDSLLIRGGSIINKILSNTEIKQLDAEESARAISQNKDSLISPISIDEFMTRKKAMAQDPSIADSFTTKKRNPSKTIPRVSKAVVFSIIEELPTTLSESVDSFYYSTKNEKELRKLANLIGLSSQIVENRLKAWNNASMNINASLVISKEDENQILVQRVNETTWKIQILATEKEIDVSNLKEYERFRTYETKNDVVNGVMTNSSSQETDQLEEDFENSSKNHAIHGVIINQTFLVGYVMMFIWYILDTY